ncbi:MAG: NAD(P)-dependent oxidoreductase [Syntrophales bacterium]|nr:NAD(P)-dependent oxidoreductase [Syntrophales bacterium]
MKAAFFDLEGWEMPIISEAFKGKGIEVIKAENKLMEKSMLADIKDAEIISVSFSAVDKSVIEALPKLKLISTRTTGFDQIDLNSAKQKGIAVINVPSYGENTVAEYAFALLLTLSRRMSMTFTRSLFGIFDQKAIRGNDLLGKTLGVIGTGRIGQRLVKMAAGFEMNIICFDPYPNKGLIEQFGVKYVPIEELLRTSDLISIHAPYTKENHHLINTESLKLVKKGVLLVNTARGPIVDTSAVLQAVKDGILGGVALDTFEGEQIWIKEENILAMETDSLPPAEAFKKALESFFLQRFKNVVLTPHNAFNSHEAVRRIIDTSLLDMAAFAEKGDCEHRIDKK